MVLYFGGAFPRLMHEVEVCELRDTERLTLLFDDNIVQIDIFGLLSSQIGKGSHSVFGAFYPAVVPNNDDFFIEEFQGSAVLDHSSAPNRVDIGVVFFFTRR